MISFSRRLGIGLNILGRKDLFKCLKIILKVILSASQLLKNLSNSKNVTKIMEEIEVIYENGVFKPLKKIKLKEGARGKVIVSMGIADILERFSRRVEKDVLKEFLEERR